MNSIDDENSKTRRAARSGERGTKIQIDLPTDIEVHPSVSWDNSNNSCSPSAPNLGEIEGISSIESTAASYRNDHRTNKRNALPSQRKPSPSPSYHTVLLHHYNNVPPTISRNPVSDSNASHSNHDRPSTSTAHLAPSENATKMPENREIYVPD